MARCVFSNPDLIRLIYSYGDPSHRKFTENLKLDLKAWPEVLIDRFKDRRLIYGFNSYSIQEYLDEYSTEKIERMISTYKRCYCCSRHNQDKPMFIHDRFEIPSPSVFESPSNNNQCNCTCTCRYLSRRCINVLIERMITNS